ncbi:TetR/AcrR family transcriptional regulator [Kineococcus rhizosphaerae]|uniref:TetR family transcriptional regulator n=1 Tax=Kineococcus rhizosphaerae TaxID=559628 RepID=A0A2T0QYU8_9ACTN|nr:TetR/AcrR family transcriptional regulator C-terminal domain-containing protein [Kineococcus rhizosphaerae]PRY11538.1 TetR family transcriptional regulator [Kineococcus rhizosphaerae]
MSPDRTNDGDPARTLALLWRDPAAVPAPGPRRRHDLDAVVAAAVDLADAEGLAAVSVRRVAARLGVAPMSLYTYVADRAELLDLMVDAAYRAMTRTDTAGRPWRARLAAVAAENHDLLTRHPWVAEVSTLRPSLGPGQTAKYEHELAALDDAPVDDVTRDACLTHLLLFVRACARDAAEARARTAVAGTDEQWWAAAGPVLARYLDPDRFPRAVRVGTAAGAATGSAHDPDRAYAFGLDRLLDGLAPLLDA